jgi:hypothetical protein
MKIKVMWVSEFRKTTIFVFIIANYDPFCDSRIVVVFLGMLTILFQSLMMCEMDLKTKNFPLHFLYSFSIIIEKMLLCQIVYFNSDISFTWCFMATYCEDIC